MEKIRTVAETLAILHQYHHPLGLERQPKQLKTSDFDGPVIFSNDPETATVPPAFFTVQTIQELKALNGVPDSRYGSGKMAPYHPLPEPFSAERLANVPANHIDLCKAFRAYVYGDSALVKDYEEILNVKRFPMKVALYSGEEITITTDNPLIIKDKDSNGELVVLVYDQITIEPEGKVICYTNGRIEANVIQGGGGIPIHFVKRGIDGETGAPGATGNCGANGVDGSPGSEDKHKCVKPPTPGTDGTKGSTGTKGSNGETGGEADKLTVTAAKLGGTVYLKSNGGDGGTGGRGGDGGCGGKGGDGGYCSGQSHVTTISLYRSANGGNGADGGDGGTGGNGGRGGDGGEIECNYSDGNPNISYWSTPGLPGAGGKGGGGGKGGDGGSAWCNIEDRIRNLDCSGSPGKKGNSGKSGEPGKPGKSGRIYINGKLCE
ncbi:collagen-like protein [Photorhabdus sp. APURE]|uniref:collagen-like triple helix repeat-containing protein n=1 Tax=Photorhabdus aballayi TaxID=2991723 RepID=UPI00223E1A0E|nr:collagen-like protein [Photorhabdus aballayi]MCW7546991.1 collagen-like protein [Photorhabdus aballayi]